MICFQPYDILKPWVTVAFFTQKIIYFGDINGGKSEIEKSSSVVDGDSIDFIACKFSSGFGCEF